MTFSTARGAYLLAFFGFTAFAACSSTTQDKSPGGSAGTAGSAGASPEAGSDGCVAWASARCAKGGTCGNYPAHAFADEAACEARLQLECESRRDAPGSAMADATWAACAEALSMADCADFVNDTIAACQPVAGTLQEGAACYFDDQCASSSCHRYTNSSICGTCAPAGSDGAPCSYDPDNGQGCLPGFTCMPSGSGPTCQPTPAAKEGEPCGGFATCERTHHCDGVCKPRKQLGDACTELLGECRDYAHEYCDPANKKCAPIPLATTGEKCLPVGDPGGAVCKDGATCLFGKFECIGPAPDGEPCNYGGPPGTCLFPSQCIEGRCRQPLELICTGGKVDPGDPPIPDGGAPSFSMDIPGASVQLACLAGTLTGSAFVRYWNFTGAAAAFAKVTSVILNTASGAPLSLTVTPTDSGAVPPGEGIQVEHAFDASDHPDLCSQCGNNATVAVSVSTNDGHILSDTSAPVPITCSTP